MAPLKTESKEDGDTTDPSLSNESWWSELKSEFSEEDEKKKELAGTQESDWWSDLKAELQTIETKQ